MMISRQVKLKEIIYKNGNIELKRLQELFPDVSPMTLHRDLRTLEEHGLITRVRGGAIAREELIPAAEGTFNRRMLEQVAEKQQIGKLAVKFAKEEYALYMDSGTTMTYFAQQLPDQNFAVVTNAPNIAAALCAKAHVRINLIGGTVNNSTVSVSGSSALDMLLQINIDTAFMSASGWSETAGFTTGRIDEANLKAAVIKKANRCIMLMDSSKAGKCLPYTFAQMEDCDVIITNAPLPKNVMQAAKEAGTEIVYK